MRTVISKRIKRQLVVISADCNANKTLIRSLSLRKNRYQNNHLIFRKQFKTIDLRRRYPLVWLLSLSRFGMALSGRIAERSVRHAGAWPFHFQYESRVLRPFHAFSVDTAALFPRANCRKPLRGTGLRFTVEFGGWL
jgi:hypothetical protein